MASMWSALSARTASRVRPVALTNSSVVGARPSCSVQQSRGAAQPVEVGGPIERNAHRPAMPGDGGLNRLPDPPHRVGDELDAAIGIELPGGGHETQVALPDEVHQGNPAVLEFLGHRDHEANVVARQPLLGLDIAAERQAGECRLLHDRQEWNPADLLEIEIQALAPLIGRSGKLRGA